MDEYSLLSNYDMTIKEIAELLHCSGVTVVRKRRKFGITGKIGSKKGVKKLGLIKNREICYCKKCGKEMRLTEYEVTVRKYCSRDCMYSDEDYIYLLRTSDRSYMKTEKYRNTLRSNINIDDYRCYRNRVKSLTESTYRENKDIINPHDYKRTLCGVPDGYQLDHIIGVRYGYDHGISAEIIADVSNLQMLPWKENLAKGKMPL